MIKEVLIKVYHISTKGNTGQSTACSNFTSKLTGGAKDKFIKKSVNDAVHTWSVIFGQWHDHLKVSLDLNK